MKKLILILFYCFVHFCSYSQTDTGKTSKRIDTEKKIIDTAKPALIPNIKKAVKKVVIVNVSKISKPADSLKRHDSIAKVDSISRVVADTVKTFRQDTIKSQSRVKIIKKPIDSFYIRLLNNPFINSKGKPIYLVINERQRQSKDEFFYLLCGLLVFLAFIKLVFKKYFKNVFRLFFQPSFRQKQTREQLSQNNLPSLLLNLFFIFSAATYVSFLLQYYHLTHLDYWLMLLYITVALLILYVGKFILLSFSGWVFDVKEATNAYVFAVYLINKILGVILIPFTLLIAFSQPFITNISITISLLLVLLLFIYRYLVSYAPVRKEVRISALHFLLYILAFEIMPLLLIYKTLIIYMDKSL